MKKYAAEFTGTFIMMFAGCGAIMVNTQTGNTLTHTGISLVWGLVVAAMIYTFGSISSAHFNPAVTLGFFLTGHIQTKDSIAYVVSQISGALLACALLHLIFPGAVTFGETVPKIALSHAFFLEIILTFMLVSVILFTSQDKNIQSFAGLAIGFTVLLNSLFAGPVTGSSMNPARSLAPAVFSSEFSGLWIYLSAPFIGGALAALFWKWMRKEEKL